LHALLAAAVISVAWAWPVRLVAFAAVLRHAVACKPLPTPALILVHSDGTCEVPGWDAERLPLAERTAICPGWVRLCFRTGLGRRDLLLFADQLGEIEWRRLRALLERVRCDPPHGSLRPGGTNLS
jgi:hypothetical protein